MECKHEPVKHGVLLSPMLPPGVERLMMRPTVQHWLPICPLDLIAANFDTVRETVLLQSLALIKCQACQVCCVNYSPF